MSDLTLQIQELQKSLQHLSDNFDFDEKEKEIKELEVQAQKPNFWDNSEEAAEISQRISALKGDVESAKLLEKEIADLKELNELSKSDEGLQGDLEKRYNNLKSKIEKEENKVFLSGKYDKNNAILEIFSGAGGQDSQDWATMLLRMYERYCATKGWKFEILHQAFGESGGPEGRIGTKSVTLEIKGNYAYGFLRKESGVHRLVRQSPFNAKSLRQTSFALVNVLPEIKEVDVGWEIKPEDLKTDTFRASGPGGQYVNKTESAIRITHLPTGIVVSCQTERLQGKNKERAMKILYAKLSHLKEENREKELKDIKAAQMESGRASPKEGGGTASWGNQIRSYVLHPYKMVKDLRTQYETSDAEGVLDGNLE
ncbi:MAG: peptide chain release factor 2, partial [Candidatus Staskawiczbacteria bacterium]|nr:peptide chain release factor 2 [Candidatus Staskawiczbacteria bacterium]